MSGVHRFIQRYRFCRAVVSCECGLYNEASSIFVYAFTLNPISFIYFTTEYTEFHGGFFFYLVVILTDSEGSRVHKEVK